jgi:voltage-gated potassium channel Kch
MTEFCKSSISVDIATDPPKLPSPRKYFWYEHQWAIVSLLALVTLCLGYIGFHKLSLATNEPRGPLDFIYLTLQLFTLESGSTTGPKTWELELARLLAPGLAAFAAVKGVVALFHQEVQLFLLRFFRGHVVICGLGQKGKILAEEFLNQNQKVVIIERNEHNDEIATCREKGAIILLGDATTPYWLMKARVPQARYLLNTCGKDGDNIEIALLAFRQLMAKLPGNQAFAGRQEKKALTVSPRLSCFVHLVDARLRELFIHNQIFTQISDPFEIKFFNILENTARQMFRDSPPEVFAQELGQKFVHLLLIGFGQMGESMALQAAKVGHYANGLKLHMTVVDPEAEIKGKIFLQRYPNFRKISPLSFHQLSLPDLQLLSEDLANIQNGNPPFTCAIVCLESDKLGVTCALHLNTVLRDFPLPILVHVKEEIGLASLLRSKECGALKNGCIHPFGSLKRTCSIGMVLCEDIDFIARKYHEIHVQQRMVKGVSQDDPRQAPWETLNENYKESDRQASEHLFVKLRVIGCQARPIQGQQALPFSFSSNEKVEELARMEHDRWLAERWLAGWSLCDESVSKEEQLKKKLNPWLIPWENLPDRIKEYDRNFVTTIPEVLAQMGYEIFLTSPGLSEHDP